MSLEKIKTTVTIKGQTFLIFRFPLAQSCTVFDHVIQSYGSPFINLITRVFMGSGESMEKIKASLKPDELEKVLLSYIKTAKQNQTMSTFELLIDPDYVKQGDKHIELDGLYNTLGLKGMFQLCFAVLKFNYSDFLSSS